MQRLSILRTLFWLAFCSLLWARIGVSIDRELNSFWLAFLLGGTAALAITAGFWSFAVAVAADIRRRSEQRRSLAACVTAQGSVADEQRIAQDVFRRDHAEQMPVASLRPRQEASS